MPLHGDPRGGLRRAANCLGLTDNLEATFTGMPLDKTQKQQVIGEYAAKEGDTGSTSVQIAVLQSRINQITDHLRKNPKDFHSRRGLLLLVGKRRRLEGYMRSNDIVAYRELMRRLGIREVKPR
jgi:small subunit ribosomal protein S15